MAQITLRDYLQETEDAITSGRIDEALADCQAILTYFSDSLEAQRLLGEVYLAQGRLEDARDSFDWVLTNDPENVVAYCSRALVSERMSDYDTALDCYQQAYELSRGNSKIRQAFNELSEKAGQPGFMFSRAGLARLYMRGHLLPQAIQEWEVVLDISPDRLDARLGLLEACWRDNLYDRVAQIAEQIIQDVSGCIKALLLLAHVMAPQDMFRSKELIHRVEAFDPDLVMAHDLFSDLLTSQAHDPFLKLLEKDAATLARAGEPETATVAPDPLPQNSSIPLGSANMDALAAWGGEANPGNETTLVKPRPESNEQPPALTASAASWLSDAELQNGTQGGSPSDAGLSGSSSQWDSNAWDSLTPPQSQEPSVQLEPWQLLQDALNGINPETVQQPSGSDFSNNGFSSWPEAQVPEAPDQDALSALYSAQSDVPSVESIEAAPSEQAEVVENSYENHADVSSWPSPQPAEQNSPPPAWLSMLTQYDHQQLSGDSPPVSSQSVEPPAVEEPVPSFLAPPVEPVEPIEPVASAESKQPEVLSENAASVQAEPETVPEELPAWARLNPSHTEDEAQDEEESFFGPEWLKSLGAATYENGGTNEIELSSIQNAVAQSQTDEQTEEVASEMPLAQDSREEFVQPEEVTNDIVPQAPESDRHVSEPEPAVDPIVDESPWARLTQQMQSNTIDYAWLEQIASVPSHAQEAPTDTVSSSNELQVSKTESDASVEENVVTTLEELELNLRSQGFIHLEPNSLSSIAQAQGVESGATDASAYVEDQAPRVENHVAGGVEKEDESAIYSQVESVQESKEAVDKLQKRHEDSSESSLSSALAAFGNYQPSVPHPEKPEVRPQERTINEQPAESQNRFAEEPSWLAQLGIAPTKAAATPLRETQSQGASREEIPAADTVMIPIVRPVRNTPGVQSRPENLPVTPPVSADIETGADFQPTPSVPAHHPSRQEPEAKMNPLLGNELETTMKRPAVRLQPMQQRIAANDLGLAGKPKSSERSTSRVIDGGNVSYRERLIRGYQAQLVGDFDNAMQEYRIIIRNAPELLGEVVSNVRALLKLAPKYSAGYRVLGDAYMRQGEYLQAMEAYNKALTMAKKAKG